MALSDSIYLIRGTSWHMLFHQSCKLRITFHWQHWLCSFRTTVMHGFVSKRTFSIPDCQGPLRTLKGLNCSGQPHLRLLLSHLPPKWARTPGLHLSSVPDHQDLHMLCLGWVCLGYFLLWWASVLHYRCRSTYRSLDLSFFSWQAFLDASWTWFDLSHCVMVTRCMTKPVAIAILALILTVPSLVGFPLAPSSWCLEE